MPAQRSSVAVAHLFSESYDVIAVDRPCARGWCQVVCPGVQLFHYELLCRSDDRIDLAELARIGGAMKPRRLSLATSSASTT